MGKQCKLQSIDKLNKLMKQSKYICNQSVCIGSVTNKKTRELHLKYHAEKKALAILLHDDDNNDNDINIAISLKMCRDCHDFFAAMSLYSQRTLTCFDTNGKHVFY